MNADSSLVPFNSMQAVALNDPEGTDSHIFLNNEAKIDFGEIALHIIKHDLAVSSAASPLRYKLKDSALENLRKFQDIKALIFPTPERTFHFYFYKKHEKLTANGDTNGQFKTYLKTIHVRVYSNGEVEETVAAKLIVDLDKNTPAQISDFNREISFLQSLQKIEHVTFLQNSLIYDGSHQKKPIPKAVMLQDLYGINLEQFLEDNPRPLEIRSKLKKLFKSMLLGMIAIHKANIIHNDVKPKNLLFKTNKKIVFCDFGLSFTESELEQGEKRNLRRASILYLAPERWKYINCKEEIPIHLAKAADIWALGCIFYKMYYGIPPDFSLYLRKHYEAVLNFRAYKRKFEDKKDNIIYNDELKFLEEIENKKSNKTLNKINQMLSSSQELIQMDSINNIINWMLHPDPAKRITAEEALNRLNRTRENH